jgi:hypothetical protein
MKLGTPVGVLAFCLMAGEAAAENFAIGLGRLLGSETACGMTFDLARVKAMIAENMKPGDLEFSSIMSAYTSMASDDLEQMGETERAAVCESARINAETLGLLASQ